MFNTETEARKFFEHGFVLTEQELRRTVDTIREQLEKVAPGESQFSINAKFKSGAISDFESMDELFSFENAGSKEITRVFIYAHEQTEKRRPEHEISLKFSNPENDEPPAIGYTVRSANRDWTLVTASELDERIGKIKCHSPRALLFYPPRISFFSFVLLLIALSVLLTTLVIIEAALKAPDEAAIQSVESRWKAGTLHDPIEALLILEKDARKTRQNALRRSRVAFSLGFSLIAFTALVSLVALALYLFPAYVFCWADQKTVYEKRVRARNYVLSAVVVALIVGTAASLIANRIAAGH